MYGSVRDFVLLLVRFLRVVLTAFLARRRGVLDESVLHFRIWPNDIDFNLHLNDGRYVSLMGLGRSDVLARTGLLRHALRRKWAPVVGGVIVRYKREIRTFARLTLRTRVVGWDDKWVYFQHRIESDGRTSCLAYARGVLRSHAGPVPTRDVLALLRWTAPSPPLPDAVVRWPELDA